MKWKASPFLSFSSSSGTKGSGRWKELWAWRIASALLMASPFISGVKPAVKSCERKARATADGQPAAGQLHQRARFARARLEILQVVAEVEARSVEDDR